MIEPLTIRVSLLDALQVDLIGPSGGLGDHREVLPQAPSRWYLTGFLVPTDADEDQRYDPNRDDEVDQAPAVATADENRAHEQAAKRSCLPSSVGEKPPSLAATASDPKAIEEAKAIFQKLIDIGDNLASCKEGVTDAKPSLVSIA